MSPEPAVRTTEAAAGPPDGTPTVELRFTPRPEHVRTARLIAAAVGRRSGIPEVLIDEVKLATGEACARAVNVHLRKAPDELVLVRLLDGDDYFGIDVVDCGPPGDEAPSDRDDAAAAAEAWLAEAAAADEPDDAHDPDDPAGSDPAAGTLPAGLGLAIIEGLVDEVVIRPRDDAVGTVVAMRWWFPGPDLADE